MRASELAAVLGLALAVLASGPASASAHGPINPAASSYVARVRSVPPGVQVRVVDGDLRLWMRVNGRRRATVLDYQGAPYLRFTDAGVEVNENSAMYYLNQTPPEIPPTSLSSRTRPRWFRTSSGDSYEWHDGRLHALALTLSSPGTRELGSWTIPLRIDGRVARITGVLDRAPAPSAGWWWPIAVVLLGLPAILRLGDRGLDRRLARGFAWVALAAFVIASVAAGLHGRPGLSLLLVIELAVELLFAGWAGWSLRRRRRETVVFFLVCFASLSRGGSAITVLWRGDVLLALPAAVSRSAVVACLAAGCGLLASVFVLCSPERAVSTVPETPADIGAPAKRAPVS